MKNVIFRGCGTALITPFTDDGNINFEELGKLIDFQILEGVDSIIICGTTGESATMSLDEKKQIIQKHLLNYLNMHKVLELMACY